MKQVSGMHSTLNRRHLLQALTAAAASLATPAFARPAASADFASALARQPMLVPLQGVSDATGDLHTESLKTTGRWPTELRGRFHRNGPALHQRGAERYHHWFDGDGMVQRFTLDGAHISHRGRLVRTRKLEAERKAGRFLVNAFGTELDDPVPATGPDSFNVANTNVIEHGGRLLALWEGGSAYELDVADLSTRGAVTWRDDLRQAPFSAHPKVDASGQLWNIGSFGEHLLVWHIDASGALVRVQVGNSPYPGGIVHDMAVTERHLVLPLPPVKLNFSAAAGTGPRRFPMDAGQPLRILVMEKADITRRRIFELPPQMVFHVGNAHDDTDGQIHLSFIGAPDTAFLDVGARHLMSGRSFVTQGAGRLQIARLDPRNGRASVTAMGGYVEFPRMDPRRIGMPARWLLSGATWLEPAHQLPLLHGLQLTDVDGGRVRRFDFGVHCAVDEHVLVPKPGRSGELEAWVLGTHFDARRQRTLLNLLDAAHLEDGPLAQAELPYVLPLALHGNFTPA